MKRAFLLSIAVCLAIPDVVRGEDFTPLIGFDAQLFPSFIISTATKRWSPPEETETSDPAVPVKLGDLHGHLGVQLISPGEDVAVKVTVTCDDVMETSTYSGTLPEKGQLYEIYPKVKYRFAKLGEVQQATPVAMTFTVQLGRGKPVEQTATAMLRPINDCPFLIVQGDKRQDISYTFAAYVNEQHPFIDKLLREALDIGIVKSFSGYQQDDPADVIRQVYSIWDALVTRDVRYSSITATSTSAETVVCQHVRLIEESLNNSQANCVDGSVLFASALRKIGIEPLLVLTPTHCYVGFFVDQKQESLMLLETTLLGKSFENDQEYLKSASAEDAVSEDVRDPNSWPSFSHAIVAGINQWVEHKEKFDTPDSGYLSIYIRSARRDGIVPIAFRGTEEFLSNGLAYAESDEEAGAEEESEELDADEATSEDSEEEMIDETEEDSTEEDADESDSKEGLTEADDEETDEDEE